MGNSLHHDGWWIIMMVMRKRKRRRRKRIKVLRIIVVMVLKFIWSSECHCLIRLTNQAFTLQLLGCNVKKLPSWGDHHIHHHHKPIPSYNHQYKHHQQHNQHNQHHHHDHHPHHHQHHKKKLSPKVHRHLQLYQNYTKSSEAILAVKVWESTISKFLQTNFKC